MLLALSAWALIGIADPASAESQGSLASYVSNQDYPVGALRRGAQGTVAFALSVDAEGRPSRCTVEQSSGDQELDDATCSIMMSRARFRPARDAEGTAVPDTVRSRITWRIEDGPSQMPFMTFRTLTVFALDTTGRLTCDVTINGQEVQLFQAGECGFLAGSGAAAALRSLGGGSKLTFAFEILVPPDLPSDTAGLRFGDLHSAAEASLAVRPDGSVADCRLVSRRIGEPIPRLGELPDPCNVQRGLRAGNPGFAPSAAVDVRRARIQSRLYLRAPGS